MRTWPVLAALVGFLVVLGSILIEDAKAATCADFPNQAAAQRAANTRDADHDGIYCEALPCPCLKPGQSSPPSSPSSSPRRPSVPRTLPATFRGRCVRGPRPDRRCTPGTRFLGVTARQVCTPGYASRVRSVSSATKRSIYLAYGVRRHAPFEYEVDHLISLELGGSNSPKNLWPQKEHGYGNYSAATKDRVENALHARVCAGTMTLAQAQSYIKHWYRHLTLAAGPAAGLSAPGVQAQCGTARYVYREHGTMQYVELSEIDSLGYSCADASRLAVGYGRFIRYYEFPRTYAGLTCARQRAGNDVGRMFCGRSGGHLNFAYYDSSPYH